MSTTIGSATIYSGRRAPDENRIYAGRLDDDRDQATRDEAPDDEPTQEEQ